MDRGYNVNLTVEELIKAKICPAWYLPSKESFGRCIPVKKESYGLQANETLDDKEVTQKILNEAIKGLGTFMNIGEFGKKVFSDLYDTWWMICMALLGACILSFLWILLMRKIAKLIIWFSILVFYTLVGALLAWCCFMLIEAYSSEENETTKNIFQVSITSTWPNEVLKLRDTWLAFTIILGIFFVIMLVIIIFLRKRIKMAIRIIEQGSKAVGHVFSALFFPLIPTLLQVVALAWFLAVALFLASSGTPEFRVHVPDEDKNKCLKAWEGLPDCLRIYNLANIADCGDFEAGNCSTNCLNASCHFVKYSKNSDFTGLQVFNVFGLYWTIFFFSAFGELVLAKVFAEYFWYKLAGKEKLPYCTVLVSMKIALVYHLGTVAFGSLIIAIIRLIRTILKWVEDKAKWLNNGLGRCILCCCMCCFSCLENFMRFINRNAYIICAVKSTNFCQSAKSAFELIMRNPVRIMVLDCVCDFLLLFGKLVIVGAIGVASYFSFSNEDVIELNYLFVPVVVIVIGSYYIASSFFGVYAMAVDTIFLCILEDIERNDGAKTPPKLLKVFGLKPKATDKSIAPDPKENAATDESIAPDPKENASPHLYPNLAH